MKRPWIKLMCSLMACLMLLSATACRELSSETDENDAVIKVAAEQDKEVYSPLSNEVAATSAEQASLAEDALAINNGHVLKFDENGEFKIIVFSDIQDGTGSSGNIKAETLSWMRYFLDTQKPDLALLAGDVIAGHMTSLKAFEAYVNNLQSPMEEYGVPWAQVNGNHEEGGNRFDCGIYKEDQIDIYMASPFNVSKNGTVPGNGNYVLPVLRNDGSGKVGYNVFCLDSHDYVYKYGDNTSSEEKAAAKDTSSLWANHGYTYNDYSFENEAIVGKVYSGHVYEPINFEQIKWYWDTSVALQEYNGQENPISAMMMFHIPVYEMNYISENRTESGFSGLKYDPISAPELSAGLFWAMYERGDVKLVINGHDHTNGFQGQYMGITMAYCATIGCYQYYGLDQNGSTTSTVPPETDLRGVRIITVKQGENVGDPCTVTTEMIYVKDINGGVVPSGY